MTMMTITMATRVGNDERGQGLEMQTHLEPQVCFISILYILVTFFYSEMLLDKRTALGGNQDDNDDNYDGNKGWEW